MHVLFIHTPIPGAPFSSSIAALSSYLNAHGYTTDVVTLSVDATPTEVDSLLKNDTADIFAWSFMSCRWKDIPQLVHRARSLNPKARHICGGAHPTTHPKETLPFFDALVMGEGEAPFLHWLTQPGHPHPGLLRKGYDDPQSHWQAPNVDALPDWDRALFHYVANDGNRYEQAVPIAFSRGFCPFACTFCGVDGYRRLHKQPQRSASRLRSVDRVMEELHRIVDVHRDPLGFAVWDEVLPSNRKWLQHFFTRYKSEIGLPLAVQMRVEQATEKTVAILADGGCDYVVIGVETGDEAYRKRFLNKGFSNAQAVAAFTRFHDAGIDTFCSFMIGLPFETPQMLAKTIRLADVLNPTELSWKYYTPERGTALFPVLEEHNLLIERYIDHPYGAGEAMIRMTHCSQNDLNKASQALSYLRGQA